jgi:hypothetical protein
LRIQNCAGALSISSNKSRAAKNAEKLYCFARRGAGIRPLSAPILTAQNYAATTTQVSVAIATRGQL